LNSGTFDYAADAWGYTYGAAAEWYQGAWTLRFGVFDLSDRSETAQNWIPRSAVPVNRRVRASPPDRGTAGQGCRHRLLTRGRMGRFDDAVKLSELSGEPADTALVAAIPAAAV
jgi:high affinity Mn2+ porin